MPKLRCPKCRSANDIPPSALERLRCHICGETFKLPATAKSNALAAGKPPLALSPTAKLPSRRATSASNPKPHLGVVIGILAVLGLFMMAGLVTALILFRQDETKTKSEEVYVQLPKIPAKVDPPPKEEEKEKSLKEKKPPREETQHEKDVKVAVQKGAAYLEKRVLEEKVPTRDGDAPFPDTQTGAAALIGLALLHSGTSPENNAVQRVLATIRQESSTLRTVYVVGTVLFFLNRMNESRVLGQSDQKILHNLALRLIAGQLPTGQWSYGCPPITPESEAQLLKDLQDGKYEPKGRIDTYPSNALTQFAMLSVWNAQKYGIPVRVPLLLTAKKFQETPNSDGSWGYNDSHKTACKDSNTCAGLLALAIEQGLRSCPLSKDDPKSQPHTKIDEIRQKAFVYLGTVIGRKYDDPTTGHMPGKMFRAGAHGDCYFLWCLERVAIIYGKQHIEGKDWYQWGSTELLKHQQKDGFWSDRFDPALDTAFAILFLTRANLAKDLTESLRLQLPP